MHTYSGVSVWRGWDLARGPALGVSSHVCLQGLRSESGWERLILHQRLGARGVPGVGTALHVSPHLTPSQNNGSYRTLYNRLARRNRPSRSFMSAPEPMLVEAQIQQEPTKAAHKATTQLILYLVARFLQVQHPVIQKLGIFTSS